MKQIKSLSIILFTFLLQCSTYAVLAQQTVDQRIPGLIDKLKHPDKNVRKSAAIELGKIGPDALTSVPALVNSWGDDSEVAYAAIQAIEKIGSTSIPVLINLLKGDDSNIQARAAIAISSFGPEAKDAVPALVELLRKPNVDMRQVISTLGSIGPASRLAIPALLELVRNKDSRFIQAIAAESLGKIAQDADQVVPTLVTLLKTENKLVQAKAAEAIGRFGQDAKMAIPLLVQLTRHQEPLIRLNAVTALGQIGRESGEVVPVVISLLDDEEEIIRHTAIIALRAFKSEAKTAIPALIRLLHDNGGHPSEMMLLDTTRGQIIETIASIGPGAKDAIPALVGFLSNNLLHDRAVKALGDIGPEAKEAIYDLVDSMRYELGVAPKVRTAIKKIGPESIIKLISLLEAKNRELAANAALAVSVFGSEAKQAVPLIIDLLKNYEPSIRYKAAIALGDIGPEAKAAVPALRVLSKGENLIVGIEAEKALQKIITASKPQ